MRRALMATFVVAVVATAAASAAPLTAQAGRFNLQLSTVPDPPVAGSNTLTITITDGGKPLSGAGVSLHVDMTTMPMPSDFAAAPGGRPGEYVATVNLSMAGQWQLTVSVQQMAGMKMAGDGEAHFLIDTGKSISAKSRRHTPWLPILAVILLAAALVGGALLIRHRGLPRGVRGVFIGLVTLAAVTAGTWWVVHRYRNPTVSTVLGSTFMDMDAMQPAPGAVPVRVEKVRPAAFTAKVTYTATVVSDVDEYIYPRVTGRLVEMPLYAGDRVHAGQVVARLDTAELAAKEAQASAGREGAWRGVEAARADVSSARAAETRALKAAEQARTQVQEALSGVEGAEGAVRATEGELAGATEALREAQSAAAAAQAGVEQAQQTVVQAQAEVDSAAADATYWDAEIAREKTLYGKGAISREELDRETAQAAAAAARLKQAQAGLKAAEAGVTRAERERDQAQARVAAAAAGVRTAEAKVAQARAELGAAHARVTQAQAGVGTAVADAGAAAAGVKAAASKVGVAGAQLTQARAAQTEASVVRGYTVIRAANSGVVTARLVSPGVLVQPGTAILRIAKIDFVRLQAALSDADLGRVRTGAPVLAWSSDAPEIPFSGEVTSVFPVRDAMARTGIVEARIPNPGGRLVPGQTVRLEVSLGEEAPLLSVPTAALSVREGQTSVWVAAQENGRLVARRVPVKTGGQAGDRTEIVSGLKPDSEVIVLGWDNLRDGDAVKPLGDDEPAPQPTPDAQSLHSGHGT